MIQKTFVNHLFCICITVAVTPLFSGPEGIRTPDHSVFPLAENARNARIPKHKSRVLYLSELQAHEFACESRAECSTRANFFRGKICELEDLAPPNV